MIRSEKLNTTDVRCGAFEGNPVRYTDIESWIFDYNGKWREWQSTGEILTNAHRLTKDAFERDYPNLPPLPAEAFPK